MCSFPTSPTATSLGTASTKSCYIAKVVDNGSSAQMVWVKLITSGISKDICVGGLNDVYVVSAISSPSGSAVEKFTKTGTSVFNKNFLYDVSYTKATVDKGELYLGGTGFGSNMSLDPASPTTLYSIGQSAAGQSLPMYNSYDTLDCSLKSTKLTIESTTTRYGTFGGFVRDLSGNLKEVHTAVRVAGTANDIMCVFNNSWVVGFYNTYGTNYTVMAKGATAVSGDNAIYLIANYSFFNYLSTPTGTSVGSGVLSNDNFVLIKLKESVRANYTSDKTHFQAGDEVTFTNSSSIGIIDTYEWSFGDGANPATATGIGPHTVTYSTSGSKLTSLKVTGEAGTHTKTGAVITYVYPNITPDFSVNNANPMKNQTVTFTSNSTGTIDTYSWEFGSGANPSFAYGGGPHNVTYSSAGAKTVSLQISTAGNTQKTEKTNLITVQNVTSLLPTLKENEMSLTIYPNPTKDHVVIQSTAEVINNAELMDVNGKIIKTVNGESNIIKVMLDGLKAGVYVLKVSSVEKVNVHQIIVE